MFTTWYKKGKLSWPLKTNGKGPGPLHLALWHVIACPTTELNQRTLFTPFLIDLSEGLL